MSSDIWAQFEQPTLTDDVAKFMSMSHVLAGQHAKCPCGEFRNAPDSSGSILELIPLPQK